ncbi:MAG: YdbL family protein [Calditrichaeota bacterium]|nr:YdbL family protein [Calditrichota bacterium]
MRREPALVTLLLLLLAGCAVQVPDVKVNLETPPLQRKAVGEVQVPDAGTSDVLVSVLAEEKLPSVREARLRQKQRRADLDSLEARGVVGETSAGTVVVLHPKLLRSSLQRRRVSKLVDAENEDRALVKAWLRSMFATSLHAVESQVETELAKHYQSLAPPGTWIQTEEGTWVRKEK